MYCRKTWVSLLPSIAKIFLISAAGSLIAFPMHGFAQQSATMNMTASFNVPVTISCGTSLDFGTMSILNTADITSPNDATQQVVAAFPSLRNNANQGFGGSLSNSSSISAGTITFGQCSIQGAGGSDFDVSTETVDLTDSSNDSTLLEFTPMIAGSDGNTTSPANLSVSYFFDSSAPELVTTAGGTASSNTASSDAYSFDSSSNVLTLYVGGTIGFKREITDAADLVGTYTGSASINVVL